MYKKVGLLTSTKQAMAKAKKVPQKKFQKPEDLWNYIIKSKLAI